MDMIVLLLLELLLAAFLFLRESFTDDPIDVPSDGTVDESYDGTN